MTSDDQVEEPTSTTAFHLHNNNRAWPNLYDEAVDMLMLSIMAYGVATINKLIRDGKLVGVTIPELPQPLSVIMNESAKGGDQFKELLDPASFELYAYAMQIVMDKYLALRQVNQEDEDDVHAIYFGDENSEKELVYGISANNKEKRLTVTFRGSVTLHDLLTDAKVSMVTVPNPLEPGTTVRVHKGFRDYLYGRSKRMPFATLEKGDEGRKLDEILDKLLETMESYPGYHLYLTGHSLGGSLAILTALELGSDDHIPKPVSCITFAAPRVGNGAFANAFFELEKKNAIRCLRIANHGDIFPRIPQVGSVNIMRVPCVRDMTYHHVGVELVLHNTGEKRIRYQRYRPGRPFRNLVRDVWRRSKHRTQQVKQQWLCQEKLAVNHSCQEYWSRINLAQAELAKMDLQEQYKELASLRWGDEHSDQASEK